MRKISLDDVFFKLRIEERFSIAGRGVTVVAGKVECGEIHDKSAVLIANPAGDILHETTVLDLDWFDRGRCGEHASAVRGMNVAVLFRQEEKEYLAEGNFIVIP